MMMNYNKDLFIIEVPEETLLLYGEYDPEGLEAFKRSLLEEKNMASSAVSHALADMLEVLDEEVGVESVGDDQRALVQNAEIVLEDYKNATGEQATLLASHLRNYLARILQYINQEVPQLVGSMEVRNAQDVLSNPHLPASDVAQGGEPALTPNEPNPVPETPVESGTFANVPDERENTLQESVRHEETNANAFNPRPAGTETPEKKEEPKGLDAVDERAAEAKTDKALDTERKTGKGKK